ncbi:MAG: hypothetical protein ACTSX1_04965 [Candidatus Heimdallarchaeaceae archaeon]
MATVLTSYTIVPELQHWYNHFVVESAIVTKNRVPPPVDIPELYLSNISFITMLFDDAYCQDSYEYNYTQETNSLCIPRVAYDRMIVYPGSSQYVNVDPDGENIFALQADDFTLLDALLSYRNLICDSTGIETACEVDSTAFDLVVIDSTDASFICDTSGTGICVLRASLGSLSTELSKLIYLFLDLKVNGNFSNYNNIGLISTGGLLQSCYESYLIDQYYKCMSSKTVIFQDC